MEPMKRSVVARGEGRGREHRKSTEDFKGVKILSDGIL